MIVGLELSEYYVSEGQSLQVCVTLELGELERDALLNVSTSESQPKSAEDGLDYSPLMLTIILPAGLPLNGTVCFSLDTTEDNLVEGSESLDLELSSNDSAVILSQSTADVFIVDNDGELQCLVVDPVNDELCEKLSLLISSHTVALFGFEQSMYATDEDDGSLQVSIILLQKELAVSINLQVNASDLTAVSGADYIFPSTDVVFAPGSVVGDSQAISISVLSDDLVENTETFSLNLYSMSLLAAIDSGRDQATVEIIDDSSKWLL